MTPAQEKNAGPDKQGDRPAAKEFNQGQVGPGDSEEHHGTHAVTSKKDRYRPNQIRGEASNSEALGGKSERNKQKPPCPLAADPTLFG